MPADDIPRQASPQEEGEGDRVADGCAMGCVALVFAAPTLWIWWMARTFLDGNTWFDRITRLVLDELIGACGVFVVVVLIRAIFAPRWLTPIVDWATENMAKSVLIAAALLFGSLLLFIVVYAVLSSLGIRI